MTLRADASPVDAAERAIVLDALRGFALFGVLLVNLETAFRVSLFQQFLPAGGLGQTGADRVVARLVVLGLELKAFSLFAFLFGVGLAAQRERTLARAASFTPYIARRLVMLLVIGLIHLFLVWSGDILTLYALLGLLAAPLLGLPSRVLLGLALALFAAHALPLPLPSPFTSSEAMLVHLDAARRAYGAGSFGDALAFRIHEVRPVSALLASVAPRTLALFLLGAWAWRAGVFRGGERRTLVIGTAVFGLGLGGAATWALGEGVDLGRLRDAATVDGPILVALGYAASLVLAFRNARAARALGLLAPLGQMALTSYLTQSIVLSFLFYGWGLGLFNRLGEASAAAIGVTLFVVQAVASARWLRRHRFGPVEWLWRSFTYGAWQPLRRG